MAHDSDCYRPSRVYAAGGRVPGEVLDRNEWLVLDEVQHRQPVHRPGDGEGPNTSQWERFTRSGFPLQRARDARRQHSHGREDPRAEPAADWGSSIRISPLVWEFGLQAEAANSNELASAIEDFLRDYPLARGCREGLRYMLFMVPMGRRMHAVTVEPSARDGATLEARIPVGRPVSRRAQLSTIGWALERASSGTRYYTRRFIANRSAPTDIVTAVDEANRALYGSRANDIRWSLNVSPTYPDGEARDAGEAHWSGRTGSRRPDCETTQPGWHWRRSRTHGSA